MFKQQDPVSLGERLLSLGMTFIFGGIIIAVFIWIILRIRKHHK